MMQLLRAKCVMLLSVYNLPQPLSLTVWVQETTTHLQLSSFLLPFKSFHLFYLLLSPQLFSLTLYAFSSFTFVLFLLLKSILLFSSFSLRTQSFFFFYFFPNPFCFVSSCRLSSFLSFSRPTHSELSPFCFYFRITFILSLAFSCVLYPSQ